MVSRGNTAISHITSVMRSADATKARFIGLTSDRPKSGVSLAARNLAAAYGNFGRKVLLVTVAPFDGQRSAPPSVTSLSSIDAADQPNLWLTRLQFYTGLDQRAPYRTALETAPAEFSTVIVDLPAVAPSERFSTAEILAPVTACDIVYLVCLTGASGRHDVKACVDACRIGGVNLAGIVLNDRKLPASNLLILDPPKPAAHECAVCGASTDAR